MEALIPFWRIAHEQDFISSTSKRTNMLSLILSRLLAPFAPILFVELSPERLTVCNLTTGTLISEKPEIAIAQDAKGNKVLATGAEASQYKKRASVTVTNPFAHPRGLVSDFTAGSLVMKAFIKRACSRSLITPAIVMRPLGEPEGGFTQLELRALQEMASFAGSRKFAFWLGPKLSPQKMLAKEFLSEVKTQLKNLGGA